MNASVLTSKIGIASIALSNPRWAGFCMGVGAALLVAGCWTGLADAQARTLVLCLLSGGIAMFAAALLLLRRRPVSVTVGSPARTSSDQKLLPAPVDKPLDAAAPKPLRQEGAAVEPEPAPATASTATIPAPAIVTRTRPMDAVLDVTALMDAPLSDLLLAALCKDPVGARRIFAKALEHATTLVAPEVPVTSDPPMPSAISPNGDARAVAIGHTTTAAP